MTIPSRCIALSFLLVAAACGGGVDIAAADRALAALVPEHAVAWLRVASLEALTEPASEVVETVGRDTPQVTSESLLDLLGSMAGDTKLIDRRRPFAFALSAPKAKPPTPLFFVPATDPARYAASLQASGLAGQVEGSYVVVRMGGDYEKPTAPNRLADGLAPGIVSLRVDVEKVAATLGVPIGSGLAVFKAAMAKGMDAKSGMDGEAIAELYVDAARAVLASTATMNVSADYRDGRLQFTVSLMAKAGSAMDGWSSAPVDLSSLDGRLSGKGSLELVVAADWARLAPRLEPMTSALFDAYPAAVRDPLRNLMVGYTKTNESMGPVIGGEGSIFGEHGPQLVVHSAPPDAKGLVSRIEAMLALPELEQIGVKVTKAANADADGAVVRDWLLQLDLGKLLGAQADAAPSRQATETFKKLFGDGLPLRIATKDGRAVLTVGKPREDVAKSFATGRGSWSKTMRQALQQVADCNPMLVERFDMAAMMGGMLQLMAAGGSAKQMPKLPAGSSADFVVSAGIRGSEWRFGLGIDVIGFSKMIKAMMPR